MRRVLGARRSFFTDVQQPKHLVRLPLTIKKLYATPLSELPSSVTVNGWVRSVRRQKNIAFAVVTDGSSFRDLQIVMTPEQSSSQNLQAGASVSVVGKMVKSTARHQSIELQTDQITVVGECNPLEYPIQKSTNDPLSFVTENMHLRTRLQAMKASLRLRDVAIRGFHDFFEEDDFIHVQTPLLTSNDAEGGGEAFRVTTDAILQSVTSPSRKAPSTSVPEPSNTPRIPEFFDQPTYLTVSSQLHLEALASSLSRVYTISPTFRAERSQTHRHLSEFSMLEAEVSFVDSLEPLMSLIERCIRSVFGAIQRNGSGEVNFFQKLGGAEGGDALKRLYDDMVPAPNTSPNTISEVKTWPRVTFANAILILQDAERRYARKHSHIDNSKPQPLFSYPLGPSLPLQSEHEKYLAEEIFKGPVFVTDYPAVLKPFYMRLNDAPSSSLASIMGDDDGSEKPETVACFDLLVPRVGEIIGGSLREERLPQLIQAMEKHGMDPSSESVKWYIDLRKYGSVPHGGFGLGMERFISWATGVGNVKNVVAYPRTAGKISM